MSHPKCFHFSTPIAMRILNSVKKKKMHNAIVAILCISFLKMVCHT